MDKFEYFEVVLVKHEISQLPWLVRGGDKDWLTKEFLLRREAFNYLGSLGAELKMQTKAGVFIFQRTIRR